ncbi:MAG: hypothetical protein KKH93_00015 [Candidatus Omnitrophica bacterium]|nr:hypothetical protein [Candidatus Omnitrophota bacterium]MBU2044516.1 hypothetical protein [Candidatus Omnitrophota bacterium]MBU2473407.1 hypothetical protein [Candidatus Omnitrophota bacterium]
MKNISFFIVGVLLLSGCVPALIAAGLVTGYSLSNASAMGNVKSEYRVLWDVCSDVLEDMEAEVLLVRESQGMIKARISDHNITVKINTISSDSQRLKVSARRNFLPKPQMAQKVFLKIVEDL